AISHRLHIPTIGIGAGNDCDGQVLVFHDILGLYDDLQPRFVKQFAQLREPIIAAVARYRQEVISKEFPSQEHSYPMNATEEENFLKELP
ncbi:MAG: 3-methyl-2-oxobutanoate hydroxymethyltransferase, partial [Candidatus Promineifilaceae bacterium]|nr:3-methyl-2-oxobutanoate hydroxymethyltransferase [Candidatus Promineifilaceae bacterium]